ncbi:MAG: Tetratricopeptide 2 repeat protein [Acidobacteria bacterium]|nr:Tetratricopeptide 2 repeat protein [Acidobacteriota bacterium]
MKLKTGIFLLSVVCFAMPSAQGGTKEELVRLQSDVLALQNQIREFDKNYNEKLEGLKSLVVQMNDQVAKSDVVLGRIAATLENQSSGIRSADQSLLQEIRTLSGKIDDASTRISVLAQQFAELKLQSKPLAQPEMAGGDLSPEATYDRASGDLVRGNYDLAVQGFTSYLNRAPGGDKAANAQYGIGESYYYQAKMQPAITAYTRILTDYPDSGLCASALYKRAKAELAIKESENAIADLKEILERYPSSSEATLAKTELQNLGVKLTKPAAKDVRKKAR